MNRCPYNGHSRQAVSGGENMIENTHSLAVASSIDGSLGSNPSPPVQGGLPHAGKSYAVDNLLLQPDENGEADLPYVFYIDGHQLGRDCVSNQLAALLPEWTIESASKAGELDHTRSNLALLIFNAHGESLTAPGTAAEIELLTCRQPHVPFIIMSDREEPSEVILASRLGARGYLPVSLPLRQAISAIRLVGEGGIYVPPCVLFASRTDSMPAPAPIQEGKENSIHEEAKENPINFSPRQLQVLRLLQEGKQNKIIAYELGMCESTVKVHIRHLMKKLKARNRTQLALLARSGK
jgi:DNA-binding NarL/FixJ family response regulator